MKNKLSKQFCTRSLPETYPMLQDLQHATGTWHRQRVSLGHQLTVVVRIVARRYAESSRHELSYVLGVQLRVLALHLTRLVHGQELDLTVALRLDQRQPHQLQPARKTRLVGDVFKCARNARTMEGPFLE